MVKVSIIVPVYNTEAYISRCLDSLINQTLKDIEIIIVNDKTPDNSIKICEKYKKIDNRIQIFNKEKNEGLGITRNYGLIHAKGEYVAFCDSDDFVDIDFYEKLYLFSVENKLDVCYSKYVNYKNNRVIGESKYNYVINKKFENKKCEKLGKYICNNNNFIAISSCMGIYNSKILKNNSIFFYSEREFISEDIIFNMDFLKYCKKVGFINTNYYYCFNSNSLSKSYKKDYFEKSIIQFNAMKNRAKTCGYYENMKSELANMFFSYVRACIKNECKIKKYKQAKSKIDYIVNNEIVIEVAKEKRKENLKKDFFDLLIKYKKIKFIYFVEKIYNLIK